MYFLSPFLFVSFEVLMQYSVQNLIEWVISISRDKYPITSVWNNMGTIYNA